MNQRTKRIFAIILFLDIAGFTDFSVKNDSEVLYDYISFFLIFNQIKYIKINKFQNIISKNIDKFLISIKNNKHIKDFEKIILSLVS